MNWKYIFLVIFVLIIVSCGCCYPIIENYENTRMMQADDIKRNERNTLLEEKTDLENKLKNATEEEKVEIEAQLEEIEFQLKYAIDYGEDASAKKYVYNTNNLDRKYRQSDEYIIKNLGDQEKNTKILERKIRKIEKRIDEEDYADEEEKEELLRDLDNYKNQLKTNNEFGEFLTFNDVEYHDSIDDIKAQGGYTDYLVNGSTTHRVDNSNRRFKSSNFVPTYEDSVFLSRVTMLSNPKIVTNSSHENAGFCHFHKNNPLQIESKCRSLSSDVCASTKCCVLLGGSSCVAGDKSGPTMKSNYTSRSIQNADHYFNDGKCYGNCN